MPVFVCSAEFKANLAVRPTVMDDVKGLRRWIVRVDGSILKPKKAWACQLGEGAHIKAENKSQ